MARTKPEPRTRSPRRYESPRRQQAATETRTAVLDASIRLFGENGWAATGVRDVAREAGVAVETVYAKFGSKVDLLTAAMDVAVVGDSRPIPVADRPEFAELGRGSPQERARAAARLVRQINERTYKIGRALREAAPGDTNLAAYLAAGEKRRRDDVTHAAQLVAGRDVTDTECDGLWAVVSIEVFQLLVGGAGWSTARYEDWLAETIVRLLQLSEEQP
jgi:AcrR family transcriptional regulator